MTAGWCSRTVRAAVFAAVCVLLAALGHVLMSGCQVPAGVLAAGFAATGVAGWSLAGRERGLPLIVSVVVAAQTALHFSFSLTQSVTEAAPPMSSMGPGHMGAGPMNHMQGMGDSTGGGSSSFGMLAAHLLAALLCGLWLACGERAAFRILRAVAGRLATPLRLLLALPVTPDRPRPSGRRPRSDRAPRLLLLVHAITSRGPPAGTAVV
ncbi:hypothetical protein [Streptomyces sp. NPDC050287]|uniref:hypothetical protein n=1 Tax=Streptomyces sp. NPDC050287 TaxID=3365608 RepID=UPI0037A54EC4